MSVRLQTVVLHAMWLANATVARAQVPRDAPADTAARGPSAVDSLITVLRSDCVRANADSSRADSAAARGQPLCLTREQAVALALSHNPQLRVAAEQIAQARARKIQGTALPDPQFSAVFDQSKGLFGAGGANERSIAATVTIPFVDKFRLQGRIGTADVQSAAFAATLARQQITSATTQTYDSLLASLRRDRDLSEAKALAQDFLRRAEARYNAGTTPKLDLVRAQVELARAENDLIGNERDVANARAALNRLVGRPLGAPIAAADSLAVPPPPPDLDRLLAAATAGRPELGSLKSQQAGAHAASGLTQEYWLPDLTVGVSHDYADPGPGYVFTGVSLPIPLYFWNHSRGVIAEAHHHELELAAAYQDLQQQVGQDLRAAHAAATVALRQALYIRDQLLPLARQAYHIASVSYGLGGSSALELLDARQNLLDAENQYTDALAAANDTRAELERAAATPLDSLETGAHQ